MESSTKENILDLDNVEIPEAKALSWLALNFPLIENPKDDIERMNNCIHIYCQGAVKKMEVMLLFIQWFKCYIEDMPISKEDQEYIDQNIKFICTNKED